MFLTYLKSLAKSLEFTATPLMRNSIGEWTLYEKTTTVPKSAQKIYFSSLRHLVLSFISMTFGATLEQKVCAWLIQNICLGPWRSRPGREGSDDSPFFLRTLSAVAARRKGQLKSYPSFSPCSR